MRAIYEDLVVLEQEWDQFLRAGGAQHTLGSFLSSKALGATQAASREGVGLLTVHSSKGLEFDVVFLAGLAEGTFPDYRATGKQKEMLEEGRNAFVAVTRSRRLLYVSYPKCKVMHGATRVGRAHRAFSKLPDSPRANPRFCDRGRMPSEDLRQGFRRALRSFSRRLAEASYPSERRPQASRPRTASSGKCRRGRGRKSSRSHGRHSADSVPTRSAVRVALQ